MSAVAVTNALAKHFKDNVTGTKAAYAIGDGASVGTLPQDIYDTPVVVVYWQHVDTLPGSYERTTWTLSADAYFNATDPAAAYPVYVAYVDALRTSIRTNWTLFGTCTQIQRWEGGDPEDVSIEGASYVRIPFVFQILEAGAVTYTP